MVEETSGSMNSGELLPPRVFVFRDLSRSSWANHEAKAQARSVVKHCVQKTEVSMEK